VFFFSFFFKGRFFYFIKKTFVKFLQLPVLIE